MNRSTLGLLRRSALRLATLWLAFLVAMLPQPAAATDRSSLVSFLEEVQRAFVTDPAQFKQLHGGTELIDISEQRKLPRHAGEPRILRFDETRGTAVALLTGWIDMPNSGDETFYSLLYSGLYELVRESGTWRIKRRIPFNVNRITDQDLNIDLDPSLGISVVDRLSIAVVGRNGFYAWLNNGIVLKRVLLDGRPVRHLFEAGVLWIDARPGKHVLLLDYSLRVEREQEDQNTAAFNDEAGHIRNQYLWHPSFGFGEPRGASNIDVTLRIAERFKIALDMPQTDVVANGIRTVTGRTPTPTELITIAYDSRWAPERISVGALTFDLFTTQDFQPKKEDLVAELSTMWALLSERFGTPRVKRIAVIQGRARKRNGWHFLSNQAIVTGVNGGSTISANKFIPQAYFSHEVAHLWLKGEGAARNFLGEGWATYTESLLFRKLYGEEMVQWFWTDHARSFLSRPATRATPLNADETNSGVAYSKGAWVFAMLERVLGREAFDQGIRKFAHAPAGSSDVAGLISSFGSSTPRAERFLKPWVEMPGAVDLAIEQEAGGLVLVQQGTRYWLPDFEVVAEMKDGSTQRMTVQIEQARTPLQVRPADVVKVHLDPREHYLMESRRIIDLN